MWRAGLRIQEALAEADLDQRRGSLLVRHREQEQAYVVVAGSGRAKLDDDALRHRHGPDRTPRPEHFSGAGMPTARP